MARGLIYTSLDHPNDGQCTLCGKTYHADHLGRWDGVKIQNLVCCRRCAEEILPRVMACAISDHVADDTYACREFLKRAEGYFWQELSIRLLQDKQKLTAKAKS